MRRHSLILLSIAGSIFGLPGCSRPQTGERAPYVPLAEVERSYGPLIAAGNHPTPSQYGTGERVGLFRDANGLVWGLPLKVMSDGTVLACAPARTREPKVTDTFPEDATIVGSTSEPTGWRSGTGDLELLLRDASGGIRVQAVHGAPLTAGPACWAPESPGPPQQLYYYRLAPQAGRLQ